MPSISNFRSTSVTATTVALAWSNCDAILPLTLNVGLTTGPFTTRILLPAASESATVTGLSPRTVYRFFLEIGTELSQTILVTTGAGPSPPTAPSSLSATATAARSVNWGWTDNSNNESGFELVLEDVLSGATATFTGIASNATSFVTPGTPGRLYRAQVRATHATLGPSDWSNWALATTRNEESNKTGGQTGLPPPYGISNLRLGTVTMTAATVFWTLSGQTHDRVVAYLYDANGAQLRRGVGTASLTGWTFNNLSAGTTYSCRIATLNEGGETLSESLSFSTIPGQRPLPDPPVGVVVAEIGPGDVRINWDASLTNGDTVTIKRDTVPASSVTTVATGLSILVTEFYENGLSGSYAGQTLRYWLVAVNTRGTSANSDTDDVLITAPGETIDPPFNNSLGQIDSETLLATWEMVGVLHDAFTLQISAVSDSGPWTDVDTTIHSHARSYMITGLTPDTQYWTQVIATSGVVNQSDPSNVATATTYEELVSAAPTGPRLTAVQVLGPTAARVYFVATSALTSGYRLYLSQSGGAYAQVGSSHEPTATSIDMTGLTANLDYAVKIRADNISGSGDSDPLEFTLPDYGGAGVLSSHGGEVQFARSYDKDAADAELFSAAQAGRLTYIACPAHATNGPWADLYVDGTVVSKRGYGGEIRLIDYEIEAGEVVTVQFSGSSTSVGYYVALFRAN